MLSEGHDGGSMFAEARPQDATLNHRPERACLLGLRMEEAKEVLVLEFTTTFA